MDKLFSLLHFAGGTFPTGAFSQSWGLETYVFEEKIKNNKDFEKFLQMYTSTVLEKFEGPIFCEAYEYSKKNKFRKLAQIDEEFLAMRLTKESRDVVMKTGKAFLRIMGEISADTKIQAYYNEQKDIGISFPIAFALTCARQGIEKNDGLKAFMFSTINGLIQSGLKLIPLGNVEAQKLLLELYGHIEEAVEKALKTPFEEAFAFCPGLDISSMKHETLPTRLYMT